MDLFGLAARKRIVHATEVRAQDDVETCFFQNFPLRGFGQSFPWVYFAFGQRDILVLGSMDKEDADFAIDHFPTDSATGKYGV